MFDILKPTAMRRMLVARERVARRNPFFASILFGANIVESKKHKTIWTNGIDVFFNPEYAQDQNNDKFIEGLLLKVVLHCAMLHMGRRRYREEERWNQACSYPVNQVVADYFPLAADALIHNKWGGMAPEQVYDLLPEQPPQGGGGKGEKQKDKNQPQKSKGQGNGDEEQEGDGDSESEGNGDGEQEQSETPGGMHDDGDVSEQGERQWRNTVAAAMEKSPPGTIPGNLQRLIQQLFPKEKIDWKDLIRDMSRDAKAKSTRTWTRPNRRRLGNDEYMPGYGVDNIYNLVMCMDVSGSVSKKTIQEMCEEAASLLDQDLVNQITLISVDTCIQNTLVARTSEDIQGWDPGGGGGTNFSSAMDTIGKMQDVIGLIFLTDMMTSSFGEQPDFPVVWVDWANSNVKAPFGRTVPYK